MMSLAPIALFVYNRPVHTKYTLEGLMNNQLAAQSDLYIFCDGVNETAKDIDKIKIDEVRSVIREKKWCKNVHIIEQTYNKGLACSIIEGITEIVDRHNKIIVLEDDIVTSPIFLSFMNDALNIYAEEGEVISISSLNFFAKSEKIPDIFFSQLIDCWGWATWKRGWDLFEPDASKLLSEIDKKGISNQFDVNGSYDYYKMLQKTNEKIIDSWAIRWYASGFIHNKLSLYPKLSLSKNIGFDDMGTNTHNKVYIDSNLDWPKKFPSLQDRVIENNEEVLKEFYEYFRPRQKSNIEKLLNKLSRLLLNS